MNKLVKASIAGGAGVILLMGGAGTLAYWNGSANLGTSQTISAGQLSVTANTDGVWKRGTTTITPATYTAVPGDVLTYTQSFSLNATGTNLYFTINPSTGAIAAASNTAANNALASSLNATSSVSVAGSNIALTGTTAGVYKVSTAGSTTITVTETVTWPFGTSADNSAQQGSVTFGAGALAVTQVANP